MIHKEEWNETNIKVDTSIKLTNLYKKLSIIEH